MRELDRGLGRVEARGFALEASGRISRRGWMVSKVLAVMRSAIYDFTTGGVTVGIDFRLTDNLVVGLMGDYSHTWSNLKPGHLEVNSGRGGLYASWFERGFYLDGAIYGGGNSIDTARSGLGGIASGGTDGSEWSAFLSAGADFHIGRLTVGPIAALQYTEVNIDGFSEKGSAAPMAIHEGSAESLRSDIGFRAFTSGRLAR
jgi:outer membrane autotransporter protein